MKNFFRGKAATAIILVATFILAGVAIFTAIRLYQLRGQAVAPNVPSSQPLAGCANPTTGLTVDNITTTSATLHWVSGSNATYEFLIVSTNSNPQTGCGSAAGGASSPSCLALYDDASPTHILPSQTSLSLTNLKPDTTYYWKMYSWVGTGCDSGTPVISFKTAAGAEVVTTTTGGACTLSFTLNIATPTPTPTATPTGTPGPEATPNACGGTCGSNANCRDPLFCYQGFCRNPSCQTSTNCVCSGTTAPTTTAKLASTATPTNTPALPDSGTSWPTVAGLGFGILIIIGSLLIAL